MEKFKLNMNRANRRIWTVYFDPKVDQISTCDLANPVYSNGIYYGA